MQRIQNGLFPGRGLDPALDGRIALEHAILLTAGVDPDPFIQGPNGSELGVIVWLAFPGFDNGLIGQEEGRSDVVAPGQLVSGGPQGTGHSQASTVVVQGVDMRDMPPRLLGLRLGDSALLQ